MKNILRVGTLMLAVVAAGCSSNQTRDARVEGVTTTVDTAVASAAQDEISATITAELESWDERVSDLQSRALTTRSRERFAQLNETIENIQDRLADAREDFLEMRLAKSDGARESSKGKLNEKLTEIRNEYNAIPAE